MLKIFNFNLPFLFMKQNIYLFAFINSLLFFSYYSGMVLSNNYSILFLFLTISFFTIVISTLSDKHIKMKIFNDLRDFKIGDIFTHFRDIKFINYIIFLGLSIIPFVAYLILSFLILFYLIVLMYDVSIISVLKTNMLKEFFMEYKSAELYLSIIMSFSPLVIFYILLQNITSISITETKTIKIFSNLLKYFQFSEIKKVFSNSINVIIWLLYRIVFSSIYLLINFSIKQNDFNSITLILLSFLATSFLTIIVYIDVGFYKNIKQTYYSN